MVKEARKLIAEIGQITIPGGWKRTMRMMQSTIL